MSGGVDSSVAAALLKEKGYDVIGIAMEIWPKTETRSFGGCCSASAVDDAKKVAAKLKVPHYVVNFRDCFKQTVIDNFLSEYSAGRTPNPCIRCNRFVKFGHLLQKADELGCEFISTGHYAVTATDGKHFVLKRSSDDSKDQSYVLYVMGPEALKRTLFPLGRMTKTKVRETAKKLGLAVADKKDSQEICFIPDNNTGAFLAENLKEKSVPGPIFDTDGNRLGMHRGIAYYTVGQRKGIGLAFSKPFYVVRIDRESNSIIVGDEKEVFSRSLVAEDVVWTSVDRPEKAFRAKVMVRYNSEAVDASLEPMPDGTVSVYFKKPVRSVTPGQSAVFYKDDVVLGGGLICTAS